MKHSIPCFCDGYCQVRKGGYCQYSDEGGDSKAVCADEPTSAVRALALAVTIEVRRHWNCSVRLLAGDIWLGTFGWANVPVPVYVRVLWVLFSAFKGLLVTATRSPCFRRCTRPQASD